MPDEIDTLIVDGACTLELIPLVTMESQHL
jgi:hypothetical protein